jgi:hypothetical protein
MNQALYPINTFHILEQLPCQQFTHVHIKSFYSKEFTLNYLQKEHNLALSFKIFNDEILKA